jgi:hypothetical protein
MMKAVVRQYEVGAPQSTATDEMAQLGKVTVVGVGQVGMACAVSLLTKVCGIRYATPR